MTGRDRGPETPLGGAEHPQPAMGSVGPARVPRHVPAAELADPITRPPSGPTGGA